MSEITLMSNTGIQFIHFKSKLEIVKLSQIKFVYCKSLS